MTLVVEYPVGQADQGRPWPQDASTGPVGVRCRLLDEGDYAIQQFPRVL